MTTTAVVLGILAVGTAFPAWYRTSASDVLPADLQGKPLVRGDKEITTDQVADLRVATWDDSQGKAKVFAVAKKDGRWTIPSHFDYPADGGSRVGSTAGGVLNVPRGPKVTGDAKQHQDLGVLDPLAQDAASKKTGIGKRVTLKDATGAVVVDLIIGNLANAGDGVRFVRDADSADVYTAKVNADISTAFTDWVETGLLTFKTEDVRDIQVNDYFIDETKGTVNTRAETQFTRAKADADWASTQAPADKQPAKEVVNKILSEATGLRLQGVRPYRNEWLMARGFYFDDASKNLYGREGRIVITTKDGLRYVLFFGSLALGDEQDIEIDSAKKVAEAKDAKKDDASKNRYVAIFVKYDENVDEAVAEAKVKIPPAGEKTPLDGTIELKKAGAEKAKKAQAKFGKYFYVVSDASFASLKPAGDKLFEAKPKAEAKVEEKKADAAPAAPTITPAMPVDAAPAAPAAAPVPAAK
jgi:hypothetical protein